MQKDHTANSTGVVSLSSRAGGQRKENGKEIQDSQSQGLRKNASPAEMGQCWCHFQSHFQRRKPIEVSQVQLQPGETLAAPIPVPQTEEAVNCGKAAP